METKYLDLNYESEWNCYLDRMPINSKDIYFTPEYYKVYEENGFGIAKCFVLIDNFKVALYPFLLNSVNNLGFQLKEDYFDIQGAYGYNGIVFNTTDQSFIKNFGKVFNKFCIDHKIIAEFTRFHPLIENYKFITHFDSVIFDRETVTLDISKDYKEIWEMEFSSKNRNKIRKARNLSYKSQIIQEPINDQLREFIDIYYLTMQKAGADDFYYFSEKYFEDTFKYLKSYIVLINIIDKRNEVVCSSIFLHYNEYFHYHLSGRTENADNSVNNFLLDIAIQYAQSIGAKRFHFGGGRTNSDKDALLAFKKNFSKKFTEFNIGKRLHNMQIYNEVISQWNKKNPEKNSIDNKVLLKYRTK